MVWRHRRSQRRARPLPTLQPDKPPSPLPLLPPSRFHRPPLSSITINHHTTSALLLLYLNTTITLRFTSCRLPPRRPSNLLPDLTLPTSPLPLQRKVTTRPSLLPTPVATTTCLKSTPTLVATKVNALPAAVRTITRRLGRPIPIRMISNSSNIMEVEEEGRKNCRGGAAQAAKRDSFPLRQLR